MRAWAKSPIWTAVCRPQSSSLQSDSVSTANDLSPDQCLAVDTESLCKLLDCGRHTAVQIGDLAHARITMNSRVLWSVQRVKEYLYEISC